MVSECRDAFLLSAPGSYLEAAEPDLTFGTLTEADNTASPFPAKTVAELVDNMVRFQAVFSEIGQLMGTSDYSNAYNKAIGALIEARAFQSYSQEQLRLAELDLACCDVEYHVTKAMDYLTVLYIIVIVFIVYVVVLRWADGGKSRHGGRRKQ